MKGYRIWLFIVLFSGWNGPSHAQEVYNDSLAFRSYTGTDTSISRSIFRIIDSARSYAYTDPSIARNLFLRAIAESRSSGFREGLVKGLSDLAILSLYSSDYDEALRNYREALHYSRGSSLRIISDIYTGLAGIYIYRSQYKQAVWLFYEYLKIAETSAEKNPPLARTYGNLSAMWSLLQDEEKQYRYTFLAEKAAIAEKDTSTLSTILFRKGLYIQDTNISLALEHYHKALEMGMHIRQFQTIVPSLQNIARVYISQGNKEEAFRYYQKADSLIELADENPFNKLDFYNGQGEGYFMLGMDKLAEQQAFKAIRFAQALQTRIYLIRTYNLLANIYERTGQYDKAFLSQKQYITLRDSLTSEQTVQTANLFELKYQTAKQDRELAIQQLAISHHETQILRKNIIIGSIIGGLLLLAAGVWVVYRNMQTKNRIQQESIRSLKREREIEHMKAIMQGEDQESIRIGQELHDGIGSMLSVIKMNLSMIPREHEELAGSAQYQDILNLLDKTSTDLRETSHNLMLDSLLQGGLDEALQHFCEKNSVKYNVQIHFLSYGQPPVELPQDLRRAVYRITRELIAYSIRQKNVTLVVVQLNWQDDMLSIILEDDMNPGMNTGAVHPLESGNGLLSRIDALNGRVDIEYGQDKGTTIDIEFDIRPDGTK